MLGNINDFEGYKLYRATDAEFSDAHLVIDPFAISVRKPIFQCDLKDGKKGLSQAGALQNQVFHLGDDTGITHYYRDDDVRNGCTYYYALAAYDYGIVPGNLEKLFGIEASTFAPLESPVQITINENGSITHLPVNCSVTVPGPQAAGTIIANKEIQISYNNTAGSGEINIIISEPAILKTGSIYYLKFTNHIFMDLHYYDAGYDYTANGIEVWRKEKSADVRVYRDIVSVSSYPKKTEIVNNVNSLLKYDSDESYYYLPDEEPGITGIFDGLQLSVRCIKKAVFNEEASGWLNHTPYPMRVRISDQFIYYPWDYHLVFTDKLQDSNSKLASISAITDEQGERILAQDLLQTPVNFYVDNMHVKDPETGKNARMEILIHDRNGSGQFETMYDRVLVGALSTNSMRWGSTLFSFDFIGFDEKFLPEDGAIYLFTFKRPFFKTDSISFTVHAAETVNAQSAIHDMDKIKVVPNPYFLANAMESPFTGEKKLMFTHLPQNCTIKIFTVSGYLIRELHIPQERLASSGNYINGSNGIVYWNLQNKGGREIAPGLYFYCVRDLITGKEKLGKFAVIK